jgi:cystathionine beta-lyase
LNKIDKLFDDVPVRIGTDSLKWAKYESRDIIPLWVADMDFRSPPSVVTVAQDLSSTGNFGYGICPPTLYQTVSVRCKSLYGWTINENWINWLPGMVCGLNVACRVFEKESSQVITNTPVYPPFLYAPGNFGLTSTQVPMLLEDNRFTIDFDALYQLETCRGDLFMLCHPHNPVGTSFTRDELEELGKYIIDRELFICSDEIHCDLILDPAKKHIPFASLSEPIADRTITLMAPSKTFNLPGFGCSFSVISNNELRQRFKNAMKGIVPDPPAMGFKLAEVAYQDGDEWRERLINYLRCNRDFAFQEISGMQGLTPYSPEATYLLWIDARELPLDCPQAFFESAGVGLSNGRDFGAPGFLRLNLGCTSELLKTAISRMQNAISNL